MFIPRLLVYFTFFKNFKRSLKQETKSILHKLKQIVLCLGLQTTLANAFNTFNATIQICLGQKIPCIPLSSGATYQTNIRRQASKRIYIYTQ